jgi:hypothetical protein
MKNSMHEALYQKPTYMFASYVAISRLPANRHWFSDAVFGASVGIIAGRPVTSHEAHPFPVAVVHVPGGAAVMYVHRGKRTSGIVVSNDSVPQRGEGCCPTNSRR